MLGDMTTDNPFVFGKAAEGAFFTDRTEDAKRLTSAKPIF